MTDERSPDLDRLEAEHTDEEAEEAQRTLIDTPRPMGMRRPPGGHLPASESWLQRLYQGDRVVREKKPGVFDHLRSVGPWFVSVDEEPLSVLDGMSQTATVCAGFCEDAVVRAYTEGAFGDTILVADDTTVDEHPAAQRYADRLRELVPDLPHVSFTNSGAEACEKALALCRLQADDPDEQRRVLAFEGSFHGRTLMALHASYNPKKRAPFEIAGHEVTYAPYPLWETPHEILTAPPPGFLESIAQGDLEWVRSSWSEDDDPLLAAEVHSLSQVHRHLRNGDHFAVIIEPMQSEGGDRYATRRFHKALRLLTRYHGVPLVYDEVQTGFGLGGTFVWHFRFGLMDAEGNPDGPDCLTFAKRAQVGVVMSRFEDPEPTHAHPASLVRGLVHAEMMAHDGDAPEIEAMVRTRLEQIAERHPDLVERPRATGYAFAFDLPSPEHLQAYIAQRFWRGGIIFAAGTRTVRYRLSQGYDRRSLEKLFGTIEQTLEWLESHPGETPPKWQDAPVPDTPPRRAAIRIRQPEPEEHDDALEDVLALEKRAYEPARQDPPERLRLAFDDPDGVAMIAEVHERGRWRHIGYCLGAPLEDFETIKGPDRDPMQGRGNTMYSVALTVDPDYQSRGIGRELKREQMAAARQIEREDGTPRYRHVSGRNRIGLADGMVRLNRAFGGYGLYRLTHVYNDPSAESWYYRMPLGPFVMDRPGGVDRSRPSDDELVDLCTGVARPLHEPPASLCEALDSGLLFGPTANKITVSNYVTPGIVRAVEWVGGIADGLPHLYLTSSRDETFDKAVRALRWHREQGQAVIGLEGGYVGHTTAAARSLSDPRLHLAGPGYFDGWPRVPHPARDGVDATMEALDAAVDAAGGAERVLGLFLEPIQERTGYVVPDELWPRLADWRERTGVPVVLVETAGACYRSGRGPFRSSALDFVPDMLTWWGGGQVGFVHASDRLFVDKPLTLVSTWDGDELSLVRVHHQLRAARRIDVTQRAERLDHALEPARQAGLAVRGEGLYRVIATADQAEYLGRGLAEHGVRVRCHPGGHVVVAPPLDVTDEALKMLERGLWEVCG